MSDGKIKLSELRTACDKRDLAVYRAMENKPDISEFPEVVDEMGPDDVAALVATYNAADALIELAEADMAYREAGRVRAKASARWSKSSGIIARGRTAKTTRSSPDEPAAYAEYQRAEDAALRAHDRLQAARARFEP